jgi:hypothetical protein
MTMYVLAYVDDLIIVSSSDPATTHLLAQLDSEFAIKDLGKLRYFLGIEVHSNPQGLVLSQQKYIQELLKKTHMETSAHPCQVQRSYHVILAPHSLWLKPPYIVAPSAHSSI